MSDTPLLNKMDALLKKHRGGDPFSPVAAEAAPPPDAWLPVLTDIIEMGVPPAAPVTAASPEAPIAPAVATPAAPAPAPLATEPPAATPDHPVDDTLTEQLMSELAPRLTEVMEKQVATELRRNLDETVATLLAQLDVNVREIVRDAVAEKLKRPRDPSS